MTKFLSNNIDDNNLTAILRGTFSFPITPVAACYLPFFYVLHTLQVFHLFFFLSDKATITNTSIGVVVANGEDARLWCRIEGFPLGPEHISWTRPNFFFDKRTSILLKNNTSYLTILNTTKFDSGSFFCVVNNGIGNESSQSVLLIVERKYPAEDVFLFINSVL